MPYKYTGSANELHLPGDPKTYKPGDTVPISEQDAIHLITQSSLHSFEIVRSGEDLEEKLTTPPSADTTATSTKK